jgi:hypothetical protein
VVLSFSDVYAVVAMVTRLRVLVALLKIVKEIAGKIMKEIFMKDCERDL